MALFGGVTLPGHPDPENLMRLDRLPMPLVSQMMRYGFAIDRDWFDNLTVEFDKQLKTLREDICSHIPEDKLDEFIARSNLDDENAYLPMNVESREQLANLLFDVLGIGSDRELKRTKGGTRISTGKKQLETLKRGRPVVQTVLTYYEYSKLKGSFTAKLPKMAITHPAGNNCPVCGLNHIAATERIHTTILDTRTDTRRYASKSPNQQQVPARTNNGRLVRMGFVAGPGRVLVACDLSQIELRDMAHCANEKNLIRIYQEGLDVHMDTAMRAFDLPANKVDTLLHRAPCKNVNFGIVYGLTQEGLLDQMAVTYATAGKELPGHIDKVWCKNFIDKWFDLYPGMADYMDLQRYRARRYGIVWDIFGGVRRVPEVRSVHEYIREAGLRQAGNSPIQMCAADTIRLIMGKLAWESQHGRIRELTEQGIWVWPLMTIHDELLYEVDEDYGSVVAEIIEDVMNGIMRDEDSGEWLFRVPIQSEAKVMERWEKG